MERLFITGGAGFIGSNFVRYWLERYPDDDVVVYDKLTYAGSVDRLPKNNPRMTFIQGDVCDFDEVMRSMKGADVVVHFAAETHVDRSLAGLEAEKLFFKTNVEGTQVLLYAAKENRVKRFHHISTDEVFGELSFDSTELFNEATPYDPRNPYSISKASADFVVRAFYRIHGLPITISNCTNNYGPYQTPEKMIPRSISLLLKGDKIKLYTDENGRPGKNIRDWLHVLDHCEAIDRILKEGRVGETYGIGGQSEVANLELTMIILKQLSRRTKQQFSFERDVELVKDRPGHDQRYAMDISKIKHELHWQPNIGFEQGIVKTIDWYLSEEGQQWLATFSTTVDDVRQNQSKQL